MLKILDHAEFEKIHILCSFWDLAGSCCVQERIDGGPCKDCSNCELGGPYERQEVARDAGT